MQTVHLNRGTDDTVSQVVKLRAWLHHPRILGDLGVLAVHSPESTRIRTAFAKDADLQSFLTKDIKKLSWREARSVLNKTVAAIVQKAAVDGAARGLSAVYGSLLG